MKKIYRLSIIILLFIMMFVMTRSLYAETIRRFAIIAGANNGGPDRVRLKYAVSDAGSMMDVLRSIGGVSDNDGILLINPDRRNMISAFSRIKKEIETGRKNRERIEFIFYYSGHSNEEAILLGREKIYYRELKDGIRKIPADVRIAILDSCSSGAFTRIKGGKFRPPFILDSSFNMKGDAFMTSSSADEASQESDSIKGSFFTYYLVSGLRGAADMIQDGRITLNEAYQYAYNETLSRTEKTLGGTQHPNYDIQMTGTGDVVITDIKNKTSGIVIERKIAGKIYIRNSDNILIAELQKPYGREMSVALPEGEYSIYNQNDDRIFESRMHLPEGQRMVLSQNGMKESGAERTTLRGDDKSNPDQYNKRVMFELDKIDHGGYISVVNKLTRIKGNWADLPGGKAAWLVNHRYALGGEGYGLAYPTGREDFLGVPYTGVDTKVALGFGGVLFEYFIWPENIITVSPGIMVGAGGIGYYNPEEESSSDERDDRTDTFFIFTPQVNFHINLTEHIRIGAGISWRYVNGIDQENITDRDLRGFSLALSFTAGFF